MADNLLRQYRAHLAASPTLGRYDAKQHGNPIEHVAWMCEEMAPTIEGDTFPGEAAYRRYERWVGFVQGVMWAEGIFSIEELRQHVREGRVSDDV